MTTTPAKAPQATRETRKFTVDEYFRMVEAGVLKPKERVELIEGEILVMPPIGPRHNGGVNRYVRVLAPLADARYTLQIQGPVRLNERSAPEPNVVLAQVPRRRLFLRPRRPR